MAAGRRDSSLSQWRDPIFLRDSFDPLTRLSRRIQKEKRAYVYLWSTFLEIQFLENRFFLVAPFPIN